jgi:hypothetical protein
MKVNKIYLDMDGVIADFEKRYKELYDMEPRQAEKNKKFNHFFDDFIAKDNFATLDLMPGAINLLNYLKTLPMPTEILSSTASEEKYDAISKQKLIWLQTHGITFKTNFVPGKKHKYKFATPDSIIIDDTQSVISDWVKAGGIAIWHKNAVLTMSILRMYT